MAAPRCNLSNGLQLSWEPLQMITSSSFAKQTSSTTASHLPIATLELSSVDLMHDYYVSVLLSYDVAPMSGQRAPHEDISTAVPEPVLRLQQALQEMLAHFPCAAGVVVYNETAGRLEVRYPVCGNDGVSHIIAHDASAPEKSSPPFLYGVPFHVAHANVALADLGDVSNPEPSLDILYASKPTQHVDSKSGHPLPRYVMAFQVTTFKCGSFTLGHTCSHAYADGYTGAAFLQNLCSIARGSGLANSLCMTPSRQAIISARDPPSPKIPQINIKNEKSGAELSLTEKHQVHGTLTRFKFSLDALEALRASVDQSKGCSRNRALMALLWTAFARVRLKVQGLPCSHELDLHVPINMRTKGFPDMGYMGNAWCRLRVPATLQELCENPLANVVNKIKTTVESMDLHENFQSLVDHAELQLREGLTPWLTGLGMPSLVGLPFYDTDCGWGPPVYVGRPTDEVGRCCIILDHPAARAWNVLVVFASSAERACFQETIDEYIS